MYNGKILFIESHGRRVWTVSLCLMIMLCLVLTFQPSKAHAIVNHIYVATTGSDTYPAGDGSPAKPYATIYQASTVATPGTIVHVAPGTYTAKMTTTASGNSTDRISYVSDTNPVTGARARIIPPTSHTTFDGTIWVNRGNYVDIDGFEIDGTGNHISNGIWNGGHHVTIKNNHVHHIEYMYGSGAAACNGNGGSGINISDFYQKYETPPVRMVGTVVTNNIVNSIGDPGCNKIQGIYISTTATVSNNIIYDIGAAGIHQWHDATANVIVNNTITDTDIGILIGAGDGYVASWPVNTDNNIVSNNIVYKNRQHGINNQLNGSVGTHNTYDSNLVYGNTILDWRLAAQNTHLNTVADEPEFVNYAGHDFHLQSDSKAINAGVTANAPSTDFEGNSRVGKVDIGAYENQVSTTKTLTFYHHDSVSTTSGNASGVWYKQALVDGVVVWEADVTDLGTAWRSETVNFTTSGPSFTLKFRLINKVVVSNYGVSLYIDDVTVNGLTITNQGFETTTGWTYAETNGNFIDGSYDSLQHNTGAKSYKLSFPNSTGLALGQDSSITQTVTTINKTLTFYHHDSVSTTSGNASGVWYKQALVNGVVVWEADVTDLGTAWRSETVNFTTSSPSFTLKFRLINKVVVSNYGVSLYIDDVTVNGLTITNQGFETTTGWTYAETNGNFIDGSYDSLQHNTGAKSYKLSFPNSTGLALGQDSSITQTVSVP